MQGLQAGCAWGGPAHDEPHAHARALHVPAALTAACACGVRVRMMQAAQVKCRCRAGQGAPEGAARESDARPRERARQAHDGDRDGHGQGHLARLLPRQPGRGRRRGCVRPPPLRHTPPPSRRTETQACPLGREWGVRHVQPPWLTVHATLEGPWRVVPMQQIEGGGRHWKRAPHAHAGKELGLRALLMRRA